MATSTYKQPQSAPMPECNGYPNDIPSTQTVKTRGTGAAIRGTKSSAKLG